MCGSVELFLDLLDVLVVVVDPLGLFRLEEVELVFLIIEPDFYALDFVYGVPLVVVGFGDNFEFGQELSVVWELGF